MLHAKQSWNRLSSVPLNDIDFIIFICHHIKISETYK